MKVRSLDYDTTYGAVTLSGGPLAGTSASLPFELTSYRLQFTALWALISILGSGRFIRHY